MANTLTSPIDRAAERLTVRVSKIDTLADKIRAYELTSSDGEVLPGFTAGAHVDVYLPDEKTRQYSLFGDPVSDQTYRIAVLELPDGRGGSMHMHHAVHEGGILEISRPRNNFPLVEGAEHYLLIAGGIGITPLLSMCRELQNREASWQLVYCTKAPADAAFATTLKELGFLNRVTFHHDGGNPSNSLDVETLLGNQKPGTHVYCCGPTGLMNAVQDTGNSWPEGTIHFEYFSASGASIVDSKNTEFDVEILDTGQILTISEEETILQALQANGYKVPYLCTEGVCGTCLVDVIEGLPDHRDQVLDETEKASNQLIAICCSRALSQRLKIKLFPGV